MELEDIVFYARDKTPLNGWIARPNREGSLPAVILSHGLSGIIDLDLAQYAAYFVDAGFVCVAYDHRNWGRSGGQPRSETDPWQQVDDMREAISYVRALPEVDSNRIGLWGTSYAGGHVLTVTALDARIRCVVSQVPLISGSRTFDAWVPVDKREKFLERLILDREARGRGEPPMETVAAIEGSETAQWIARNNTKGTYQNALTLRSFDLLRAYEPSAFVPKISPTPLMMIVAMNDTQTPTAWQREAFVGAGDPKRLVEIDCRHYDVYMDELDTAAQAATEWFATHL